MGGNNEFFENFERNKYLKKLPSMKRVQTVEAEYGTKTFKSSNSKASRKDW